MVKATELRVGDRIWLSLNWWQVEYVARDGREPSSAVLINVQSTTVPGVGMMRKLSASQMIRRLDEAGE